ncbi:MAG: flagellar biosynthetic protein FliO [Cohaesibacter sp.]|nr:flagellar biosynthetic protein FliO [Cohaesibacter sp.]
MNGDSELLVQFLLALGAVLFLIAVITWMLKKVNLVSSRIGRLGEEARLSVSEAVAVDHRRRLVLVKRDHVEHLILIGGENDLLLEHAIPPQARPQPQTQPPVAQTQSSRPLRENIAREATKNPVSKPKPAPQPTTTPLAGEKKTKEPSFLQAKSEKLTAPVSAAIAALSKKATEKIPEKVPEKASEKASEKAPEKNKDKNQDQEKAFPKKPEAQNQPMAPNMTAPQAEKPKGPNLPPPVAPLPSAQAKPQQQEPALQPAKETKNTPAKEPVLSDKPAQQVPTMREPLPEIKEPSPQTASAPEEKQSATTVPASKDPQSAKPQKTTDVLKEAQKREADYQDEISRLLDELSSDSKKP